MFQFILLDTFPLAETGDIVSFGNDSYLVLGFNGKTEKRTLKYSGSDLQVSILLDINNRNFTYTLFNRGEMLSVSL